MDKQMKVVSTVVFASMMALFPVLASSQDDQLIELDLRGSIEPRCEIAKMAPSTVDFSVRNTGIVNFEVYCNVEMAIAISARNGALVNEDGFALDGANEAHTREYDVTLNLEAFDFMRKAEGRELIAGVRFEVTEGIVFQSSGALNIELRKPVAGGFAGEYVDEIRISVSPSLSQAAPS